MVSFAFFLFFLSQQTYFLSSLHNSVLIPEHLEASLTPALEDPIFFRVQVYFRCRPQPVVSSDRRRQRPPKANRTGSCDRHAHRHGARCKHINHDLGASSNKSRAPRSRGSPHPTGRTSAYAAAADNNMSLGTTTINGLNNKKK